MNLENPDEYKNMVKELAKPGGDIVNDLNPGLAHLLHMAVGIASEAGEFLDAVKKGAIYKKELDYKNLIEELGDLEFYLEGARQGLSLSRNEVLLANKFKLEQRYPDKKYTNEDAQTRKDK